MTDEIQNQDASISTPQESAKTYEHGEAAYVAGKIRAEERAKREALQEKVNQLEAKINAAANPKVNEEDINKVIDARVQAEVNARAQAELTQEAQEFVKKIEDAQDKYPDFAEKVAQLNLRKMPDDVWRNINKLEHSADIIYAIAQATDDNPARYSELLGVARETPWLLEKKIKLLQQSIKVNESGKNIKIPATPLSQAKPSPTGMDSGKREVHELRQLYAAHRR